MKSYQLFRCQDSLQNDGNRNSMATVVDRKYEGQHRINNFTKNEWQWSCHYHSQESVFYGWNLRRRAQKRTKLYHWLNGNTFGVEHVFFFCFISTGFGFCMHVRCSGMPDTKLSQTLYPPEMVSIERNGAMNEKREVLGGK